MAECWKDKGRVGGKREELQYLNNLAPCGWDDRRVILKEGPAAREMRGCNETQACVCECVKCEGCSSSAARYVWFNKYFLTISNQPGCAEGRCDTRPVCVFSSLTETESRRDTSAPSAFRLVKSLHIFSKAFVYLHLRLYLQQIITSGVTFPQTTPAPPPTSCPCTSLWTWCNPWNICTGPVKKKKKKSLSSKCLRVWAWWQLRPSPVPHSAI